MGAARTAMSSTSDETLFDDFRRGDAGALDALVARHWGEAVRTARRILADPAGAEDAAQEALVALVRAAPRTRLSGPFAPWFRTLVLNAARNIARGEGRRERREEAAGARRAAAPREVAEGERRLLAEEVEAHVRRLPLDVRVAVVVHYWEGRSHEEVGRALGCPPKTAASRIRRGLERLRETLGASGFAATIPEIESAVRGLGEAPPGVADHVAPAPAGARLVARAAAAGSAARIAFFAKAAAVALLAVGLTVAAAPRILRPTEVALAPAAGKAESHRGATAGAIAPAATEQAPIAAAPAPAPGAAAAPPPASGAAPAPAPAEVAVAAPVPPAPADAAPRKATLRVEIDLGAESHALFYVLTGLRVPPIDVVTSGEKVVEVEADRALEICLAAGTSFEGYGRPDIVEEVRLVPGEERRVRLVLPPPEGRVGVELALRNADGTPAVRDGVVLVRDWSAVEPGRPGAPMRSATDDSGIAVLGLLPPGDYAVHVGTGAPAGRIRRSAGRERFEIALRERVPARLRVVSESGRPLRGAVVELEGPGRLVTLFTCNDGYAVPQAREPNARLYDRDAADDPAARVPLPLGDVFVRVRKSGFEPFERRVPVTGEDVVVTLPGALSVIEGSLARPSDVPDGTPVEARIGKPGEPPRFARGRLEGGRFRLELPRFAPPATLFLAVGDARPVVRRIAEGESGAAIRLEALDLEPGLTLRGRVAGERLTGADGTVTFVQPSLESTVHASIGPDGRFELRGLAPGRGSLSIVAHLCETASRRFVGIVPLPPRDVDPAEVPGGDLGTIDAAAATDR